jgi:hypothetical protein
MSDTTTDTDHARLERARQEHDRRKEGRYLRAIGAIGGILVVLAALGYRLDRDEAFPYEVTMGALVVCAIVYQRGRQEKTGRPLRAAICEILDHQAQIKERLTLFEETFVALAEALPEEVDKRWWKGFGKGFGEGATDELGDTGTSGRMPNRGSSTGDIIEIRRNRAPQS